MTTPAYRMPAEWEPHAATWIAWPHNPEDWPGKFRPIPWVYAEIVRHLSRVEKRPHPGQRPGRRARRNLHAPAAAEPTSPAPTSITGPQTASGCATPAPSSLRMPTATSPLPTGSSMPGPNTTTGIATIRSLVTSPGSTTSPRSNLRLHSPTTKSHRIVLEGGSINVNGAGC